jgi:carboxymethylenebutenolidase
MQERAAKRFCISRLITRERDDIPLAKPTSVAFKMSRPGLTNRVNRDEVCPFGVLRRGALTMKPNDRSHIEELAHLHVDGAFDRRELLRRVAGVTGSIAAATMALESVGLPAQAADEELCTCPEEVRVPEDAEDLEVMHQVEFPGDAGTLFAHQARPRHAKPLPGILVIHENRGLNDHIRDVTRRAARAGYVAVGIDLLSRFGGTPDDPEEALRLHQQTTAESRLADMLRAIEYLQNLVMVQGHKLGAVGFCAGGGNCWHLALNTEALSAAVVFYGAPVPPVDGLDTLASPVLAIYAERDRTLTRSVLPVITRLEELQKPFGFHIYEGTNHAFHNDTGANYHRLAACDAWCKTVAFFQQHLQ